MLLVRVSHTLVCASEMWGSGIESMLKQKVLARTGDTDPDYLKSVCCVTCLCLLSNYHSEQKRDCILPVNHSTLGTASQQHSVATTCEASAV